MSYALESLIERFAQREVARTTTGHAVIIRTAREDEAALLRDLAVLDSAEPLQGPALVAVVDGRPWAAHGIDDDRAIADPFHPSAEAASLLRLRVRQLRAAAASSQPRVALRRRLARRVGA
jgi:hypothetical protein